MWIRRFVVVSMLGLGACAGNGGSNNFTDAGGDGAVSVDGGSDGAVSVDAAAPLDLGASCDAATQCASGFCADGVCCESACDGACATCGAGGVCGPSAATVVCRAAAGACDEAETCTGSTLDCPADAFALEGVECRAAVPGGCDFAELCGGGSAACPADTFQPAGHVCEDDYVCSGSVAACPTSCTQNAHCAPGVECVNGACLDAKWVFLTASSTFGDIGGLAAADAFCQAHADSVGLGGTFRAWLSDATGSPSTRFVRSSVPYVLPSEGGTIVVADDYADLTDGTLDAPVNRNESGGWVTSGYAYTNTSPSGTAYPAAQSCAAWTNATNTQSGGRGFVSAADTAWTNSGSVSCNVAMRLYCFEQ